MKERSIIMTGESVRAIMDGLKTVTRRVMKPQPELHMLYDDLARKETGREHWCMYVDSPDAKKRTAWLPDEPPEWKHCPFGVVGDRLWVRELWAAVDDNDPSQGALYRAHPMYDMCEDSDFGWRWVSPILMPRWASRLTLELTDIRIERLHDITEPDAQAEGVHAAFEIDLATFRHGSVERIAAMSTYRIGYKHAWDEINEKRAPWSSNPWVWVLSFRPLVERVERVGSVG